MQVIIVHHEDDAGLLALDEAACEAVGNASARGPSAGIQVITLSAQSVVFGAEAPRPPSLSPSPSPLQRLCNHFEVSIA